MVANILVYESSNLIIFYLLYILWVVGYCEGFCLELYGIERNTGFLVLELMSDRMKYNLYWKRVESMQILDGV